MPKAYSEDLRMRIVKAFNDGEGSQTELARRFGVNRKTVAGYLKLQAETGQLKPRHRPGNTVVRKLEPAHLEAMDQWLRADPSMTWVQMAHKLKDEFDITINQRNVGRRMRARGWKRKKTGAAYTRA